MKTRFLLKGLGGTRHNRIRKHAWYGLILCRRHLMLVCYYAIIIVVVVDAVVGGAVVDVCCGSLCLYDIVQRGVVGKTFTYTQSRPQTQQQQQQLHVSHGTIIFE